jgi:hypothetical protein
LKPHLNLKFMAWSLKWSTSKSNPEKSEAYQVLHFCTIRRRNNILQEDQSIGRIVSALQRITSVSEHDKRVWANGPIPDSQHRIFECSLNKLISTLQLYSYVRREACIVRQIRTEGQSVLRSARIAPKEYPSRRKLDCSTMESPKRRTWG